MTQSKEPGMPLSVYERLWELNSGFQPVRRALSGLRQQRMFHAREIERFSQWIEEARAATASYFAGAIEEAATTEAGRLFRLRLRRERKEE
jgi:hypothetical protein